MDEVTMTLSRILQDKDGKAFVCVRFERKNVSGGLDEAEMRFPACKVTLNRGFSPEEIRQMTIYLKKNEKDIKSRAKAISSFLHIF